MEKEMDLIKRLEALLMKDVETVVNKGTITPTDYQCLNTAVDIWKDLDTIKAMHEYSAEQGMVSGNMYPMHPYGNSYDNGSSYGDGYFPMNSYARGRSPYTGRYVSRDDGVHAKLNNMMAMATNEGERQIIQRLMNEL